MSRNRQFFVWRRQPPLAKAEFFLSHKKKPGVIGWWLKRML